jgi:hypothetical protein
MSDDSRKTLFSIASNPKVQAIGMAWYDAADYPQILALMTDADRLPASYNEWLQRARNGEKELLAKGSVVIRAVIKPDAFCAWCALRGLKFDAKARTLFASEEAARQVKLL